MPLKRGTFRRIIQYSTDLKVQTNKQSSKGEHVNNRLRAMVVGKYTRVPGEQRPQNDARCDAYKSPPLTDTARILAQFTPTKGKRLHV